MSGEGWSEVPELREEGFVSEVGGASGGGNDPFLFDIFAATVKTGYGKLHNKILATIILPAQLVAFEASSRNLLHSCNVQLQNTLGHEFPLPDQTYP